MRRAEKNQRRERLRPRTEGAQSLEDLLKHLGVEPDAWEYVIVGDGSGTTLNNPCGSSSVMIERATMQRTEFGCTLTHGTNIMAELFAYVVPLLALSHTKLKRTPYGVRIHVVTDCQHLQMAWEHKHSRKKNQPLWELLESFKRRGIHLTFHWIPRATWDLNKYCDAAAGLRRKSQSKVTAVALKRRKAKSIYDINPMTE